MVTETLGVCGNRRSKREFFPKLNWHYIFRVELADLVFFLFSGFFREIGLSFSNFHVQTTNLEKFEGGAQLFEWGSF